MTIEDKIEKQLQFISCRYNVSRRELAIIVTPNAYTKLLEEVSGSTLQFAKLLVYRGSPIYIVPRSQLSVQVAIVPR